MKSGEGELWRKISVILPSFWGLAILHDPSRLSVFHNAMFCVCTNCTTWWFQMLLSMFFSDLFCFLVKSVINIFCVLLLLSTVGSVHKFQQRFADSIYQIMNAFLSSFVFFIFCLSPGFTSSGSQQGKKASISQSVTLSSLLSASPVTLSLPYCITSYLSSTFFCVLDVGTCCGMCTNKSLY